MSGCAEPGCPHGDDCQWAPLAAWVRTQGLTPVTGEWMDMGDHGDFRFYKHKLTREYIWVDPVMLRAFTPQGPRLRFAEARETYERAVLAEIEWEL